MLRRKAGAAVERAAKTVPPCSPSPPASDFVNGQLLYVDGGMLSVL